MYGADIVTALARFAGDLRRDLVLERYIASRTGPMGVGQEVALELFSNISSPKQLPKLGPNGHRPKHT
jgi:hypothetical protein